MKLYDKKWSLSENWTFDVLNISELKYFAFEIVPTIKLKLALRHARIEIQLPDNWDSLWDKIEVFSVLSQVPKSCEANDASQWDHRHSTPAPANYMDCGALFQKGTSSEDVSEGVSGSSVNSVLFSKKLWAFGG